MRAAWETIRPRGPARRPIPVEADKEEVEEVGDLLQQPGPG